MKSNEAIRIVIAENSVIIRNGMTAVLRRVPNLKIQPMEVLSTDALQEFIRMHTPDILIVNPVFDGYFVHPILNVLRYKVLCWIRLF